MTTAAKIQAHLETLPEGTLITAKSLLHLGTRVAIDIALMRLHKASKLERVSRGVYCKPKVSQLTGGTFLPPTLEVVQHLAKLQGEQIGPHGAVTVNRFGLSTQVPLQLILLTTGRSKTMKIGWQTVQFRHVAANKLPVGDSLAGMAITALHYLRKTNEATLENTRKIWKKLPQIEQERLSGVLPRLPAWMSRLVYQVQADTSFYTQEHHV
jgi:predicted transcriptional regulator of viral defense system